MKLKKSKKSQSLNLPTRAQPLPSTIDHRPSTNPEEITYYIDGKKKTIKAKILKTPLSKGIGLMFQKNSPPLLFVSKKFQWLPITSIFCKPFKAIWLDDKMNATKAIDVKTWKFNINGYGKYLLEIPLR